MMVLSDEIYEYIRVDGAMASIGALAGMASRTITVNGFSKGFAMTGWRLGYAAAPDPIARAIVRMQSTLTAGANSFVQRAALAALEAPRDAVEAMRRRYRARRDTVVAALRAMPGVRIGDIPATFYAFPDVSAFIGRRFATSEPLCDWLLDAHGLAVVPGTAFGAPGSLRLSFAAGEAEIEKGLTRLKTALAGL
jgi:aspartate/methionine/tyrosine aminotransferase